MMKRLNITAILFAQVSVDQEFGLDSAGGPASYNFGWAHSWDCVQLGVWLVLECSRCLQALLHWSPAEQGNFLRGS